MANKRNMLSEAIADAKAVREAAIANAKAALEESFTPHLKSTFSQKIEEMEEKDMYEENKDEMMQETSEEVEEELNLEALLSELEEGEDEDLTEAKKDDEEEKEDESEEKEEKEDEDDSEQLDLENMTEDDLESIIADVVKDMLEKGELESLEDEKEDEEEMEGEMADGTMDGMEELPMTEMEDETMEEEVNIDELLSEILSEEEEVEEIFGRKKNKSGEGYKKVINDLVSSNKSLVDRIAATEDESERRKLAEPLLKQALSAFQALKREMPGEDVIANMNEFKREIFGDPRSLMQKMAAGTGGEVNIQKEEVKTLKSELSEAYSTIKDLRSELNEINLLNAKLLYTNKLFRAKSLTENQKVTILETFDKAKNVSEVKLVYETLKGGIASRKTKTSITENKGSASKATKFVSKSQEPIIKDSAFERMKQLAFYKSQH